MKITLVREEKESGREAVSTCEADVLLERIKTETKAAHVTALRTMLLYTTPDARGHYEHIDKLPRIYPAVEYGRSRDGGRKLKRYNGIVMLEVNGLAGLSEVELVKEQARLLPQTWAAITGRSGRSVKIWVKDMGEIRASRRKPPCKRGEYHSLSCLRLSYGCAVLSTHTAVSHNLERA